METERTWHTARRVLVVDEDLDTRLRVKEILKSANRFKLAGDFPNADEALNHLPRLQPHLILLGICVPSIKDIEYIRRFKSIFVGLKIVVLTGMANADLLESSLRAGAESCLVKPFTTGQCLATLTFAECRQTDSENKSSQMDPGISGGAALTKCSTLSQREGDVLRGLAEGLLYKEIAGKLGISYSAVHKYQHRLFEKLRVSNRSEAIALWLHTAADQSGETRVPSNL